MDQIQNDTELQDEVMNSTHHAIALSAADNGVYHDEFVVKYKYTFDDMFIEQDLCSRYILHLTALKYVIQNEDDEITSVIKDHWNASKSLISLNKFNAALIYRFEFEISLIFSMATLKQTNRCAHVATDCKPVARSKYKSI